MRKTESIPQSNDLVGELDFLTSRSSGPGGQNVNKVNSKVTLKFDITHSRILNDDQKGLLFRKLASRLTNDGVLYVTAQDKRSQLQNKEATLQKLNQLLIRALSRPKARRPTKPTKSSVRKRVDEKKRHSDKKKLRKSPPL